MGFQMCYKNVVIVDVSCHSTDSVGTAVQNNQSN